MGDYLTYNKKQKPWRDAFEEEEEAMARERSLFGNPYKKQKKIPKGASEDSVILNEEEEEGSHGFDVQSTSSTVQTSKKRRRMSKAVMDKYPPIGKPGIIVVPDFKTIKFTYSLVDYEAQKQELLERGMPAPALSSATLQVAKELELIMDQEPEEMELDVEESSTIENSDLTEEISAVDEASTPKLEFTMSWTDFETNFYQLISAWPKDISILI